MLLRTLCLMRGSRLLLQPPTRDSFSSPFRFSGQQQAPVIEGATSGSVEREQKTVSNPFAREPSPALSTLVQYTGEEASGGDAAGGFMPRDVEEERQYKVLQLEVSIASQEGKRVPSIDFLKKHHWEHIINLPTKSARQRYYSYLWQIEKRRESSLRKKQQRQLLAAERVAQIRKEREENSHIIYGLGHVSMFLRIYESTMDHWMNAKLIRAMQFSPKVVLDCSYDEHMTKREAENTAKQLMLTFAENRFHDDPFDLHFCNSNLEEVCMRALRRHIPTMLNPEFPMNIHGECFTKLFPKDKLVYLTPHCRTDLALYNPDDIYIIGAMVDNVNKKPLSLAKAKRLGLRMARLPLDQYLQWGAGSGKSLTLNQMINILLDLKQSGDWSHALRHVPRRKITDPVNEEPTYHQRSVTRPRSRNRVSVRLDKIMFDADDDGNPSSSHLSNTKSSQFDLTTWASGKRK